MYSYIDLYFAPEGTSPLEIADRVRHAAGLSFIIGPHDIAFEWTTVEDFRERLAKIHGALRGTGVLYRIETLSDEPGFVAPAAWPPLPTREATSHPGF